MPHVISQMGRIGQIHAQHHLFFTNESNCNTTIYSQITVITTSHVISATRYEPWNGSGWTRVRPGTAAATKQQHVEKHVYLTTDGGFVCQMEPTSPPRVDVADPESTNASSRESPFVHSSPVSLSWNRAVGAGAE